MTQRSPLRGCCKGRIDRIALTHESGHRQHKTRRSSFPPPSLCPLYTTTTTTTTAAASSCKSRNPITSLSFFFFYDENDEGLYTVVDTKSKPSLRGGKVERERERGGVYKVTLLIQSASLNNLSHRKEKEEEC